MNEQLRAPKLPMTTQAAEGLMRRRWSVDEIESMVRAGIIEEDERFELLGGEVVPMSPKGIRHEVLKTSLARFLGKRLPDAYAFSPETTFRMSADTYVEPDFVIYRVSDGLRNLSPSTCLLAIEIADSSLAYDSGRKALLYSNFAVRELWVIEANSLVTLVMRAPGLEGYRDRCETPPDAALTFAPGLELKLGALQLV